jgi:uncharacterized MAPEG superfamily protein
MTRSLLIAAFAIVVPVAYAQQPAGIRTSTEPRSTT